MKDISGVFFKQYNQFIKEAKGVNNSGTFHRICNECDNNLFKDYEDENKLLELPRKKIMAQIDLKIYDKRLNEISIYRKMLSETEGFWKMEHLEKQKVNYLDLNEIEKEFQRALDILNKKSTSSYELIYWNVLDYVHLFDFKDI